jgi:hypothetical protein
VSVFSIYNALASFLYWRSLLHATKDSLGKIWLDSNIWSRPFFSQTKTSSAPYIALERITVNKSPTPGRFWTSATRLLWNYRRPQIVRLSFYGKGVIQPRRMHYAQRICPFASNGALAEDCFSVIARKDDLESYKIIPFLNISESVSLKNHRGKYSTQYSWFPCLHCDIMSMKYLLWFLIEICNLPTFVVREKTEARRQSLALLISRLYVAWLTRNRLQMKEVKIRGWKRRFTNTYKNNLKI